MLTISGRLLGKDKAADKAGGLGGLEGGEPRARVMGGGEAPGFVRSGRLAG